jgi:hypothetical protein
MLMNLLDEVLKRFSVLILFMMGYLKKWARPHFYKDWVLYGIKKDIT